MLNADWLGAPRLRSLRTISARGINTWRAFGAPSHFLFDKGFTWDHNFIFYYLLFS